MARFSKFSWTPPPVKTFWIRAFLSSDTCRSESIVLRRRDTKESSVFDKMLPVDDNGSESDHYQRRVNINGAKTTMTLTFRSSMTRVHIVFAWFRITSITTAADNIIIFDDSHEFIRSSFEKTAKSVANYR